MKRMLITILATLGAFKAKQEMEIFIASNSSPEQYLRFKRATREIKRNIRQLRREGDEGRAGEEIYFHNLTGGAFQRN